MPHKKKGETKDDQVGFRVFRAERKRIDDLIARIQAENSRVSAVEIYYELIGLKYPAEFVTEKDRMLLGGAEKVDEKETLPEAIGDRRHK